MLLSFMSELTPQSKMLEYVAISGNPLSLVSLVMACGSDAIPIKHVVKISFTDLPPARQKFVVFNTSRAKYSHTFPLSGKSFGGGIHYAHEQATHPIIHSNRFFLIPFHHPSPYLVQSQKGLSVSTLQFLDPC